MFKRSYPGVFLLLSMILLAAPVFAGDLWQEIDDAALKQRPVERQIVPNVYKTFSLDRETLDAILRKAPMEFTDAARNGEVILSLPMPDGTFQQFRIENSPVMEPGLAAKFPGIQTFRGQGIDDKTASVRFDVTPAGFHAMILSAHETTYIDPYAKGDTGNYISYHKTALNRTENHICLVGTKNKPILTKVNEFKLFNSESETSSVINGANLRTYRLALAATGEYTAVFGGTVPNAMAAITTTMNRVNGVYERDVAVRMVMIANNNLLVYTNGITDPYDNDDGFAMLDQNQATIDAVIGNANYDIGHVFSTGGGGVAQLDSPCATGFKAQGVTGLPTPVGDAFDIDFVAHEMGHQFGGNHTFNTSCGGNREAAAAYEPGSGITIMGYAGVCGAQDLALHSIDTFHVKSLEEIVAFLGSGGTCAVSTATGNTPPTPSITGGTTYNIPKQTPFTLTATATDPNGDTVTYDWQEYDLGASTSAIPNTDSDGNPRPILRPYLPTTGARTFPQLTYILNNNNVPPSTYGGGLLTGELLPAITRTMQFQVIARDNRANGGGVNTATATVNVSAASGPFAVTAPSTGVTWAAGPQTVTWTVAGTTGAPVNAANVEIALSTNGGSVFTTIEPSTPNDGSQVVNIPAGNTTTARIRVKAAGNIFFDISGGFTINGVQNMYRPPFDFDGDHKTDISIFRPSAGEWWYLKSSNGSNAAFQFGNSADKIAPADYTGDGKTDIAFWRPSTGEWFILRSEDGSFFSFPFGTTGDVPAPGDFDGDQKADAAVFRPSNSTWFILRSTGGTTIQQFGTSGDVPVTADYDGDGKADIAIFRPSNGQWWLQRSTAGLIAYQFGETTDKTVPGDYTGDGKADVAFWRPSTGEWFVLRSENSSFYGFPFGASGDIPVPGDYDGDGKFDAAVFRPSGATWFVQRTTAGTLIQNFGLTSDTPLPSAFVRP